MENLTNEQIVDMINFYKMCGISEDMYLSKKGVLDLFSLLGISPEYDEHGNRLPTVYEQLAMPPVFREGKEVPIVFAIKHKVEKIYKPKEDDKILNEKFMYSESNSVERINDKVILNKLKQDYLTAVANGNLSEATRIYDLIDLMTGGKADFFIGVQFNAVKFYKKMQKQLIIDMFANFVILLILTKQYSVKDGIVKFDKLYKSFIQSQLKNGNFGLIKTKNIKIPDIKDIKVSIKDSQKDKSVKINNLTKNDLKVKKQDIIQEKKKSQGMISYIKNKVQIKLNKLKKHFLGDSFSVSGEDLKILETEKPKTKKATQQIKILEND